ncbi:MAG: Rieske 2Fe-2S domain-containing protein [Chloroflexi bacterium]|nr:Rieske 2Fe-2S domain-containing protein [Chloroflexota bacterium]OJV99324.1 MAG: hypothetical protein BGO39_13870 [Chloroflexi bacterium 54-19]
MLSKEQNELFTRVGPGTPMGNLLRQFWVPAARSAKLEAGGAPLRVRLFGENFVAFRTPSGEAGFLEEACPHRGVSLALARNEDCGLRCIFHGWKIGMEGKVLEVPSEPVGSNLASKVRVRKIPVRDSGGVVWVWLGDGENPPQFPNFEFTELPLENVVIRKGILHSNWAGVLEGFLDSAHVTALHRSFLPAGKDNTGAFPGMMGDLAPRYEFTEQPYGFTANAARRWPDGTRVDRITEYVLPWYTYIPNNLPTRQTITVSVPLDDEWCTYWQFIWDQENPLNPDTIDIETGAGKNGPDPDDFYQPKYTAAEVWGQDRTKMGEGHFSGFNSIPLEDFAVQESQGAITDRTKEHLGVSDVAVIRMRRTLLDLMRDYQQGKLPAILQDELDYSKIWSVHKIVPPAEKTLA